MVFPKEAMGVKFVWIPFTHFDNGTQCLLKDEPAVRISLKNREDDWMEDRDLPQLPQPDHLKSEFMQYCADLVAPGTGQ
jgi:hypothetical protein